MAFTSLETGTLEVGNPLLGSALNVPKALYEPGTLAAHKGHFGQGALLTPFTASLVSGPSATAPFSYMGTGLSNHSGVHNNIGTDVKVGSNLSLGALEASYNAISQKITGLFSKITPGVKEVTPASANVSSLGKLLGFWTLNGIPISTEPDNTSDIRLKKNITRLNDNKSLSQILQLNPISYQWKEEKLPSSFLKQKRNSTFNEYDDKPNVQIGLIAQEVEKIVPEACGLKTIYEKEYKTIRYAELVPVLISAVQEQQKQITELKEKVAALEAS